MILWPAVREAVQAVMTERGVSLGQLSAWTGLPRSTIRGATHGDGDTQWGTAAKILSALGLDLKWVHALGGNTKCKSPTPAKTTSPGRGTRPKPPPSAPKARSRKGTKSNSP